MKFLATVLIALWSLPVFSFSLTEFAALDNAGKPNGFIHWHGHGTLVMAKNGAQSPFLVSLTMRNLGNHAILFQYHVITEKFEKHMHLVAQVEDHGLFTIYVPKQDCEAAFSDKEPTEGCNVAIADHQAVDLSAYHKSGWGHSVGSSMYFDYQAGKGIHSLQHFRSYHDEHGNFRLASTGSMGTDEHGLEHTWTDDLKRVFVHRPH